VTAVFYFKGINEFYAYFPHILHNVSEIWHQRPAQNVTSRSTYVPIRVPTFAKMMFCNTM